MQTRCLSARAMSLASGAVLAIFATPAARAKDAPEHAAVGQTIHLSLEKDATKDYLVSLNPGNYWILWDGRRVDGAFSNMIGTVQLLKNNGSVVDSSLLNWNEIGMAGRTGKQFHVPK